MNHHIAALLDRFDPISLSDMSSVSLLKRTDTKYLLHSRQLENILAHLHDRYRVLRINDMRIHRYQTLYFDTPDFALYRRHHNGGLNRYKVRCRKYVDTNLCYLEVKFKTNTRQTSKSRMKLPDVVTTFEGQAYDFLRDHYPDDARTLGPKSWSSFSRITLVSKRKVERLTIDLDLNFQRDHASVSLPGVVIAEVKQEKFSLESDFIQALKAMNLQPVGFSKYCIGAAMLYLHLRRNNFKPKFLLINQLGPNP